MCSSEYSRIHPFLLKEEMVVEKDMDATAAVDEGCWHLLWEDPAVWLSLSCCGLMFQFSKQAAKAIVCSRGFLGMSDII
jgi:hypothetical protein